MKRWLLIGLLSLACAAQAAPEKVLPKVLRYAFPIAETGFDPVMLTDDIDIDTAKLPTAH